MKLLRSETIWISYIFEIVNHLFHQPEYVLNMLISNFVLAYIFKSLAPQHNGFVGNFMKKIKSKRFFITHFTCKRDICSEIGCK